MGMLSHLVSATLKWHIVPATKLVRVLVFSVHSHIPDGTRKRSIAGAVLLHAIMFILPIAFITLPKPKPRNMDSGIMIGLFNMINTVVAPFLAVLQFYPQFLEMRRSDYDPGSLSLRSLGLQVLIFTAVAVRWFLRLGAPAWEKSERVELWMWYVWGMLPFNYLIHAVGSAILLAGYILIHSGGGYDGLVNERLPLLG